MDRAAPLAALLWLCSATLVMAQEAPPWLQQEFVLEPDQASSPVESPPGKSSSDGSSPERVGLQANDAVDAHVSAGNNDQAEISPEELGGDLIRERYPDGQVKIERYVIQDESQNYLSHGMWKMWDPQRNLVCQGTYRFGQRHGTWRRSYLRLDEAAMLATSPYSDFALPYESTAQFVDGRLSGVWEMRDARGQMVFRWEFFDGKRHGTSQWWYPNGNPMRELHYEDGVLQGAMREWDMSGTVVTDSRFVDGRRIETKTERYPNGQLRYEGTVMHPRLVLKTPDDWWQGRLAVYEQEGKFEKHGPWTTWYESGQKKMTGSYEHDAPRGTFVWWHPNGQKALEGQFDERGKKSGEWTWWHPNGMKSIQGEYLAAVPHGGWTWWSDEGKVAQRTAFSLDRKQMIAETAGDRSRNVPQQSMQQSRRRAPARYLPYRQ